MSKVCRNCQAEIDWNPRKREELGYRGPLNKDQTPHRCYDKIMAKFEDIEPADKPPARPSMSSPPQAW
jgi:hypothetical protein